jgi:hypothetical protein
VSGQQTTGKTTALKQLDRAHELMGRQRYPERSGDRIPVVYVTTPPKGSPANWRVRHALSADLSLRYRDSEPQTCLSR